MKPKTLYIVATPIGHPRDITLRALDVLQSVDVVICEELREGAKLLKKLGVKDKVLIALNEHNEHQTAPEIVQKLISGSSIALISDGGTPVFADPGSHLIKCVLEENITVIPIPGPSSLMSALSVLDTQLKRFVFAGFLSRKNEIRIRELTNLRKLALPIVLMDTPYRLERTLEEIDKIFGSRQRITVACDLTLPGEKILRGTVHEVKTILNKCKAEFIMIIHVGND